MDKPVSIAAKLVNKLLDDQVKPLGSLTEAAMKAIVFYLRVVMCIDKSHISVKYEDREIVIWVYGPNDKYMFFSPKDTTMLDKMAEHYGISDYKIRFATRSEVDLMRRGGL